MLSLRCPLDMELSRQLSVGLRGKAWAGDLWESRQNEDSRAESPVARRVCSLAS